MKAAPSPSEVVSGLRRTEPDPNPRQFRREKFPLRNNALQAVYQIGAVNSFREYRPGENPSGPRGAGAVNRSSRITLENNEKIRPQMDQENASAGAGGGGGGIRTHGTVSRTPVFKTGALNRSATPPDCRCAIDRWPAGAGPGHADRNRMPLIVACNAPSTFLAAPACSVRTVRHPVADVCGQPGVSIACFRAGSNWGCQGQEEAILLAAPRREAWRLWPLP